MANNFNTTDRKGKITCDRSVLTSIVNLATREINGVESYSKKNIFKKIFASKKDEGTKIKFEENGSLAVDIYINVDPNISVPDVAFKIQENVKNSLATMVGMKPKTINIHVMDTIEGDAI